MLNPLLGRKAQAVTPIRTGGVTGRIGEFGPTRVNSDSTPKIHKGLDLLCSEGWPIFAAHDGVAAVVGYENPADPTQGYGIRVKITHKTESITTVYAHLQKALVKQGEFVVAGTLIGLAGRSGNVGEYTPTHLHFEVRTPDPVDPAPLLVEV